MFILFVVCESACLTNSSSFSLNSLCVFFLWYTLLCIFYSQCWLSCANWNGFGSVFLLHSGLRKNKAVYHIITHTVHLTVGSCSCLRLFFFMVQLVVATYSTPPSLPRVPLWSCGCLWSWLVSSRWCFPPGALLSVLHSWVYLAVQTGREKETMAERWDFHSNLNY